MNAVSSANAQEPRQLTWSLAEAQENSQLSWSLAEALFEGLEQRLLHSAARRKCLGEALQQRIQAQAACDNCSASCEQCDNCSASCAGGSLVCPSREKRAASLRPSNSWHPANRVVSSLPPFQVTMATGDDYCTSCAAGSDACHECTLLSLPLPLGIMRSSMARSLRALPGNSTGALWRAGDSHHATHAFC
ncbi:hypothetical protein T484DRAFT_1753190 [Baffinella frigidus]|nr:hypothetical protein T484DRAFT_1753190 [Cryptophyta sp. CCMP2293]